MRISDWSSDVCSSDLDHLAAGDQPVVHVDVDRLADLAVEFDDGAAPELQELAHLHVGLAEHGRDLDGDVVDRLQLLGVGRRLGSLREAAFVLILQLYAGSADVEFREIQAIVLRSEEHTSELQSLMRISYAVFCLTKK